MIWEQWYPVAAAEHAKKQQTWKKNEAARCSRIKSGKPKASDAKPQPEPKSRMLQEDAENFLRLAAALKIILAHSIRDDDIPRAKTLLFTYLQTFLQVRFLSRVNTCAVLTLSCASSIPRTSSRTITI